MWSLSYFKGEPSTLESAIAENNYWLAETWDSSNLMAYDDPKHPSRNEGNLFLKKYSEFSSIYMNLMNRSLPVAVTSIAQNLTLIIVSASVIKIVLALLFAAGEQRAGKVLVWLFYPLRILFYFNPFSQYNQPRVIERKEQNQDDERFEISAQESEER